MQIVNYINNIQTWVHQTQKSKQSSSSKVSKNMMKVRYEISKILKPAYEGTPPSTKDHVPLSVFDMVAYSSHIAVIYAYRPPTPSNFVIEVGLQKALAVYREWAGRLGEDELRNPVILLNDEGIRFIEASVDNELDEVMPFKPSPSLLSLHPGLKGVAELMQIQLTRFACGSLVVGLTAHHHVADGQATSNFLMAWGKACRGIEIAPLPCHNRNIFSPRKPLNFDFEHKDVEFTTNDKLEKCIMSSVVDDIVVHKVHFTREFLTKLKAKASIRNSVNTPYSTFESIVAHLWRSITKARALNSYETTHVRISVNGRTRLNPKVPNEYFGNCVLWAFPSAKVKDLLREPVSYAAKLIHDSIAKVNDKYFKSFIDYASYNTKNNEDLIPTMDMNESFLCPNLEVDSWLRLPFNELDFGGGCPYIFMPSYSPTEGMLFLLPSSKGDGGIVAFVPLFKDNLASFKQVCHTLD